MRDDDQQLLSWFRSRGDESAFSELVRRHLGFVHSVARRVTCSEELAKDVAQTTFIRLATRAGSVSDEVSLATWLHRTAKSAAVDCVRKEVSRKKAEVAAHGPDNEATDPDWAGMAAVIDGLIDGLKLQDREVILQRFYQGRSYPVIAAATGLTEQAARRRCTRALEKLRNKLALRGILTGPAALAALLPGHLAGAAPAGSFQPAVSRVLLSFAPRPLMPSFRVPSWLASQKAAVTIVALTILPAAAIFVCGGSAIPLVEWVKGGDAAKAQNSAGDSHSKRERFSDRRITDEQRIDRPHPGLAADARRASPAASVGGQPWS